MAQGSVPSTFKWSARQVITATLLVVAVAVGFWLLYRFRSVLLYLFIAILIGTAIRPAVERMTHFKIPRMAAEVLIFVLLLAAVVGFLLLVVPMVLEQSTAIADLLSGYYENLREFMLLSPSRLLQRLGFRLPFELDVESLVQPTPAPEESPPTPIPAVNDAVIPAAQVFSYVGIAARSVFSIIAVLLLTFYWTLEADRAIRTVLLLVPSERRETARELFDTIQGKLGGYLIGQGVLMLVIGGLQLVAYLAIGLPNALVLAIIAGIMEAVPTIGPVLGAIPAIMIAAATDPSKIIWVLVSAGIIQLLENNLLVPRIMGKSVGVHPLLTLLVLAALSTLLGITGALLAVPVAAIIQLIGSRLIAQRDEPAQPEGRDLFSLLRLQVQEISQDIRKKVRDKEDVVDRESDLLEDKVEALANDLDRLLAQAQESV